MYFYLNLNYFRVKRFQLLLLVSKKGIFNSNAFKQWKHFKKEKTGGRMGNFSSYTNGE
jgi:hypothetical protein